MEDRRYGWIAPCTMELYYPWRLKGHRRADGTTTRRLALLGLSHFLGLVAAKGIGGAVDGTVDYMQFTYGEVVGKDDPADDDANRAIACGLVFMGLVFSHKMKYDRHSRLCLARALTLGNFSDADLEHMAKGETGYKRQMRELLADIDSGAAEFESMITENMENMENKQQNENGGGGGVSITNNYGQVIGTMASGAHLKIINETKSDAPAVRDRNDVAIMNIVREVVTARTEDGQPLMTTQTQWFAVFRVLADYCDYPSKATEFCRKMIKIKLPDSLGSGVPECKVESIQQAGKTCPKLQTTKPADWDMYSNLNKSYQSQWLIAEPLMKKLGILSE